MGGVEKFIDTLCKSISLHGVKMKFYLYLKPSKKPISFEGYNVNHAKENIYIASTGFSIGAF